MKRRRSGPADIDHLYGNRPRLPVTIDGELDGFADPGPIDLISQIRKAMHWLVVGGGDHIPQLALLNIDTTQESLLAPQKEAR